MDFDCDKFVESDLQGRYIYIVYSIQCTTVSRSDHCVHAVHCHGGTVTVGQMRTACYVPATIIVLTRPVGTLIESQSVTEGQHHHITKALQVLSRRLRHIIIHCHDCIAIWTSMSSCMCTICVAQIDQAAHIHSEHVCWSTIS